METTRSTFELDDVERCGAGGGAIPVAVDPSGGVRVLLGRERFQPQWKGSCRWSGFEGSRKSDEDVLAAAAREFREESLGQLHADLNAHWLRIVLRIDHDRRPERYHCTYVVPVAWDPELPERFLGVRADLKRVEHAVQEWCYTRPAVLGDGDVGPVEVSDDAALVVTVQRTWEHPQHPLPCPWVRQGDGELRATLTGEVARGVLAWHRLRCRVERVLFAHEAVCVRRCKRWNLLQSVHVSPDFLEKDRVRWWTTAELAQALEGRGCYGCERFRPYFLPVLHTLLQEMDAGDAPRLTKEEESSPPPPLP